MMHDVAHQQNRTGQPVAPTASPQQQHIGNLSNVAGRFPRASVHLLDCGANEKQRVLGSGSSK